ncbi:MAG: hypothetical protein ABIH42_02320 [Planctomycetota bacterium]
MKVFMLMSDAAVAHKEDGTFSILRGGINEVHVPSNHPVNFRGALVIRISAPPSEKGHHSYKLVCIYEDGEPVAPDLNGEFTIPERGRNINIVLNIQLDFTKIGKYEFKIFIDKTEQDSWPITVKKVTTHGK